jgi:hypothetical protein
VPNAEPYKVASWPRCGVSKRNSATPSLDPAQAGGARAARCAHLSQFARRFEVNIPVSCTRTDSFSSIEVAQGFFLSTQRHQAYLFGKVYLIPTATSRESSVKCSSGAERCCNSGSQGYWVAMWVGLQLPVPAFMRWVVGLPGQSQVQRRERISRRTGLAAGRPNDVTARRRNQTAQCRPETLQLLPTLFTGREPHDEIEHTRIRGSWAPWARAEFHGRIRALARGERCRWLPE